MTKSHSRTSFVFSILPWLWITGLIALALRARIFLGHWPTPAHPDPKSLPFELHYMTLWFGFYLVAWLLPILVAFYLLNAAFFKRKFNRLPLWTFSSGWSVIAVLFFAPHTTSNWVAWFLD